MRALYLSLYLTLLRADLPYFLRPTTEDATHLRQKVVKFKSSQLYCQRFPHIPGASSNKHEIYNIKYTSLKGSKKNTATINILFCNRRFVQGVIFWKLLQTCPVEFSSCTVQVWSWITGRCECELIVKHSHHTANTKESMCVHAIRETTWSRWGCFEHALVSSTHWGEIINNEGWLRNRVGRCHIQH